MNPNGRTMLAERTEKREYMRLYMRRRRAGLIISRTPQPRILRPRFMKPGHCDNCGHSWPAGGRCPLCALEAIPVRRVEIRFRVRRWIAWAQLMEALAA